MDLFESWNYVATLPDSETPEEIDKAMDKLGLTDDELSEWVHDTIVKLHRQPEFRVMVADMALNSGTMPFEIAHLAIGLKFGTLTGIAYSKGKAQEMEEIVYGKKGK